MMKSFEILLVTCDNKIQYLLIINLFIFGFTIILIEVRVRLSTFGACSERTYASRNC